MASRKSSILQKCIAALMLVVLLCGASVPAYAATETNAVEMQAAEVQALKKKTVIIGDSRTAQLREVRTGDLTKDLIAQEGSILWDYKWGAKFTDLATNLIPRLEFSGLDTINNKTTIVVWMGYNDTSNLPTATANDYVNYLNLMTALWTARGARVFIMNVGPSGNKKGATDAQKLGYESRNQLIRSFNKTLKDGLSAQATYLDCYGFLMRTGYATTDGTHYKPITTKSVWRFLMQNI